MSHDQLAESLHRLMKAALDTGAAESIEAAEAMFRGYRLVLDVGDRAAGSPHHQTALLTAVNLARRVFLGGVQVVGDLDTPLLLRLPCGRRVGEAVQRLGGLPAKLADPGLPVISIGGPSKSRTAGFGSRTIWRGWCGGAAPQHSDLQANEETAMPLAPMAAAALAVTEAFFHVRGGDPGAGRRLAALSLWSPGAADPFSASQEDGPPLERLPSQLWLIGLGHLGQAYLWALGLLPYPDPAALSLVLQDMDRITPSTESTSVLSDASACGCMKTRAMAEWAEARGFSTRVVERYFDDGFRRRDDEPPVALCGLDNALGRRALDKAGFELVVEAGLGRGAADFQTIRLHTLPGARSADELWPSSVGDSEDLTSRTAYTKMLAEGALDRCGVTVLAGKAVGAPFVGAVAAALAISELLRRLHGGPLHHLIDMDLAALGVQQAIPQLKEWVGVNPGYVPVQ